FHGLTTTPQSVIKKARYVFTSQYLTMLMAMQTKRLVVATYGGRLKQDYLECHPAVNSMVLAGNAEELIEALHTLGEDVEKEKVEEAYMWAKRQSWKRLTEQYMQLWKK